MVTPNTCPNSSTSFLSSLPSAPRVPPNGSLAVPRPFLAPAPLPFTTTTTTTTSTTHQTAESGNDETVLAR